MHRELAVILVAACGGSGGTSGGVDAPPATANDGFITLQSYSDHNVPNQANAGGRVDVAFSTGHTSCTSLGTSGPCEELDCSAAVTAGSHSAGTITVTGAALPVSITPGTNGTYTGFMANQVLFNGGETLTVAASGAEVPAFMKSVTVPGKATITSPAKPPSASPYLMITRASGFTLSWTGGSGKLFVSLDGGTNRSTRIQCKFDASAGSGTVPADALMKLPAGNGGFAMAAITETSVTAGDWGVSIEGYYNAVWPDDAIVSGPTTLQ